MLKELIIIKEIKLKILYITNLNSENSTKNLKKADNINGLRGICVSKTVEKRVKKGIDKRRMLWYNSQALNERPKRNRPGNIRRTKWSQVMSEQDHRKFTKKGLDKRKKLWYNDQVAWEKRASNSARPSNTVRVIEEITKRSARVDWKTKTRQCLSNKAIRKNCKERNAFLWTLKIKQWYTL